MVLFLCKTTSLFVDVLPVDYTIKMLFLTIKMLFLTIKMLFFAWVVNCPASRATQGLQRSPRARV
jgi:hypothetical protein